MWLDDRNLWSENYFFSYFFGTNRCLYYELEEYIMCYVEGRASARGTAWLLE